MLTMPAIVQHLHETFVSLWHHPKKMSFLLNAWMLDILHRFRLFKKLIPFKRGTKFPYNETRRTSIILPHSRGRVRRPLQSTLPSSILNYSYLPVSATAISHPAQGHHKLASKLPTQFSCGGPNPFPATPKNKSTSSLPSTYSEQPSAIKQKTRTSDLRKNRQRVSSLWLTLPHSLLCDVFPPTYHSRKENTKPLNKSTNKRQSNQSK